MTHALPDELETLLRELLVANERALAAASAHRAAIAAADPKAIADAISAQEVAIAHLKAMDTKRAAFVAAVLGPSTPPARRALVRLTDLLPMVPEPRRGTLATLAETVRDVATTVQREQRIIREASRSLTQHIQGLISRVAQSLSHAGTYDGRASVRDRAAVVSGLDLTS